MLGVIFKYFCIILCSIYVDVKLLGIHINKKIVLTDFIFSVVSATIVYFTRENLTYLSIIIIVLLLFVINTILFKPSVNKNISFTIISVGISYIIHTITSTIISPFCYIAFNKCSDETLNTLSLIVIGLIQILMCFLIFKIKRLKNGIDCYESKLTSDFGVFISASLLLTTSLINNQKNTDRIATIIFFFISIIGFLLLIWWRKHISNIYVDRKHNRDIEILENELSEKDKTISDLTAHNEELSKIIHRDNKLIPAMQLAIEEILNCDSPENQKEKSKSLINQLRTMTAERTQIVTTYENSNKKLPTTGIVSLDSSLKYLLNKANQQNISFNLSVTADTRSITSIIEENELNTLILDLGENAIIATTATNIRNILIVISTENQHLSISVYDSGIPFEPRVIANLGIKRITTHKSTGGSGIGMMTTFELLKKYQASFMLNEILENNSYSKQLKLCFDGESRFDISTERKEHLSILNKRKNINSI